MKLMNYRLAATSLVPLVACSSGNDMYAQPGDSSVPLYDNLGSYHYEISTSSRPAQQYFDQGLRLYYGFNHAESIRAFNEAVRLDPECAICHWGTALAYGPNINVPMDSASGVEAYAAIQKALAAQSHASPKERALIEALAARYSLAAGADRASLDSAYARAMGEVARRYPDDPEATTLYAESLMTLSPWNYWTSNGEPRPDTREILSRLERVLAQDPAHPGANHFYIHAVEAVDPERAVPMAERLAGLMPGAGHLVHMPGHIYIRVGRYMDAIRANEHAVHADETYIRDQNPGLGVYTAGYYPHNHDFLAFAASMVGRSGQSIEAAETIATLTPVEMLGVPGMTFLQHHHTRNLQMKVRFGRWNDILNAAAPDEDHPHARAMWHYARGRALVATGNAAGADAELAQLRATAESPEVADLPIEFNTSGHILGIAARVLAGEIAASRKDYDTAIAHLRDAARLEDEMTYGEPPEWSIPVRHDLGAVLLDAGRAAEAEAVYREDLKRFPENGWSLKGFSLSLTAQGKTAEAAAVERRFADAWKEADVKISASRL